MFSLPSLRKKKVTVSLKLSLCPSLHFFIFYFLAVPCCLRDLSSPTRDWPWATAVKALSPNHWTTRAFPVPPFRVTTVLIFKYIIPFKFISLNNILLICPVFDCVVVYSCSWIMFTAVWCSITWIYYNLFIHSTIDEHCVLFLYFCYYKQCNEHFCRLSPDTLVQEFLRSIKLGIELLCHRALSSQLHLYKTVPNCFPR